MGHLGACGCLSLCGISRSLWMTGSLWDISVPVLVWVPVGRPGPFGCLGPCGISGAPGYVGLCGTSRSLWCLGSRGIAGCAWLSESLWDVMVPVGGIDARGKSWRLPDDRVLLCEVLVLEDWLTARGPGPCVMSPTMLDAPGLARYQRAC